MSMYECDVSLDLDRRRWMSQMPLRCDATRVTMSLVALFVIAVALAILSSSSVAARWSIVTTTSSTHLAPNAPRNEAQQLTVDATEGTFALTFIAAAGACSAPETTAPISANATASEVQAALESLSGCIGEGNVTVTGGPGGATPYAVTFVGERGNRAFPLMEADASGLKGGTTQVIETVHGATVPYLLVRATNVGGTATDGSTITLTGTLPASLTAASISGFDAYASGFGVGGHGGAAMSCSPPPTLSCSYSGAVTPGDMLVMRVNLSVGAESLTPEEVEAQVAGGGATEVSTSAPVTIDNAPAPFGPVPGTVDAALSTNQAGAHANVTTSFALATDEPGGDVPAATKDVRFDLPPGLVGNTVGVPRCTMSKVVELNQEPNGCPSDTMVGMAIVTLAGDIEFVVPVYNIAPASGEPAAFAFSAENLPVRLDTSVLSNGNYAVRVSASDLRAEVATLASSITIWGVPADHSGPGEDDTSYGQSFGGPNPGQTRTPLLANPQTCQGPLNASMSVDSWLNPGGFVASGPIAMGTLMGCELLSLESSFTMLPDTYEAGAPAGYTFGLSVPQHNEPDGLATPSVKNVKLTLPAGVVVNPSAAWGLKACSDAQFFGPNKGKQEPATLAECPREAQVGTVRIKSPSLEEALEGQVYLAEPECNPCTPEDAQNGKMIRLFLQVVSEGEGGIVIKLAGRGSIDQNTGQITATFENTTQQPFTSAKVDLGGGPRAVLANPRICGSVTSNLDLTPWSTPFTADSTRFYSFEVNQGCFGPQFHPSFTAGVTNLQAGEYGPFTLSFGRSDQDEFLGGLELKTPPGLLGSLAHIPLCPEPQASQGTCGSQSLIGHTQVLTGPGANPFLVTGGQVFLTEGYKGAPFGLSIVVPAVAGPYTLSGTTGHGTVVVRAQIFVDPQTAALTVKSDPLPTMLDGIPLQLKVVNVTIDRPEFIFAPTNCSKLQITGTLSSSEGLSAPVASPFQVTNCASLAFKPKFTVSTSGKTSKANGASLSVKLAFPNAPQGAEANIHSVSVDLPKQLPSRLTTLQKACTAAQFESNPAGCPAASIVGHARATTPLLPVPVEGPAYFVSHGGEAFPSLILVLQGYGVTVDLVGTTFISKAGITSSTFKTVPDVPVGSFELTLPQGPFSALTANGSLCQPTSTTTVRKRVTKRVHGHVIHVERTVKQTIPQPLSMPTGFVAQNGAQFSQTTKIAVTGCPKKKAKKGKKASSAHHGKGKTTKKK
jgi:hypothetical protein